MNDIVLELQHITKKYGQIKAVDNVSLTVRQGEIFGFLGPNGSGKTTSIGIALGLLHATEGKVVILGQEVTPLQTGVLRRVGSLVGAPAMVPYLSGWQNLELVAREIGISQSKVGEVLERVALTQASGRPVRGYSLGMKQRLGLAKALLGDPALLILDEPTNGLDPAGMKDMRELLLALARDAVTVFLSSHLLREVEQVCDSVAVLNKGRVISTGKVPELLGGRPEVQVKVPVPAEAATILAKLPGATEVRVEGPYVVASGVKNEDAITVLMAHGIVPNEVFGKKLDLESMFFEITREDARQCSN